VTYAPERLYQEIAYVAYHFHWSLDDIADMDHLMRRKFINEIATINRRLSTVLPPELSGPIFGTNAPSNTKSGGSGDSPVPGRVQYDLAKL
jgi:hypothetical protein